jgi:hypothetical protein
VHVCPWERLKMQEIATEISSVIKWSEIFPILLYIL